MVRSRAVHCVDLAVLEHQMRWSPAVAHRILQVRAAVANGRLKQANFALAACPPVSSRSRR
ncbi:hypothetical protein FKV68_23630 (plasmid) [Sinorhizobium mexicanum]|uniref:Uncharacterized protein n=1 Tax=Sinorhizobium mexicanum TaxID=375549 RepID=A0A859QY55_9HYPH|nr:hypothetical protein FKV68_23630 [Sinorhizobium mexicanum]